MTALQRTLLVIGAFVLAAGMAELGLRLFYPVARNHFALVPGTDRTIIAAPQMMPGIFGVSHYRVNQLGIRGPAFGEGGEYRILAIGASTTECLTLDDTETWPYLLGSKLDTTLGGLRPWVGNVGRSGVTSRDNVLHLKYILPEIPPVDAVVVLVGVNDMMFALSQGWSYRLPRPVTDPAAGADRLPLAFAVLPGRLHDQERYYGTRAVPWYKRTAWWQLARQARARVGAKDVYNLEVEGRTSVEPARLRRRQADVVDSLPSLLEPLLEYRRNLDAMIDIAHAANVRLIFLTQPSVWRDSMAAVEKRLLRLGEINTGPRPGSTFFSTGALARAMAHYNALLLDVCAEQGVECVDLATKVSRDTLMMYDEVHFTEAGARRVAQVLAGYLGARPPWDAETAALIR